MIGNPGKKKKKKEGKKKKAPNGLYLVSLAFVVVSNAGHYVPGFKCDIKMSTKKRESDPIRVARRLSPVSLSDKKLLSST